MLGLNNTASTRVKPQGPSFINTIGKLFVLSLVWVAVTTVLGTAQTTNCNLTLTPDPGPLPLYIEQEQRCAHTKPQTPTVNPWLASASDPTNQEITVSTEESVQLGYRYIGTVGWRHDSPPPGVPPQSGWLLDLNNQIVDFRVSSQGGANASISGIARGHTLHLTGFNNTPGFTAQRMAAFTLNSSGGFTDDVYTVTFTVKSINHFSTGRYVCVGPGDIEVNDANDFGRCPSRDTDVTITIRTTPPPEDAYNHEAILEVSNISASPGVCQTVPKGQLIQFRLGMRNRGEARGGITSVEFKNPNPTHVTNENSSPPAVGDPYSPGGGYNSNSMASGEGSVPHYYRSRSQTPSYGEAYWEVKYQPTGYRISSSAPSGLTLNFRSAVTRATPDNSTDFSDTYCFVVDAPPPPTVLSCPGDPTINANNNRTVTLPDLRTYPASSSSSPGSDYTDTSTSPRPTVYQDVNQSNPYRVNSANDQWGQSADVEAPIGTRSDNPFTIGYKPFIEQYPYDFHSPTVNYTQYYRRYTWTDNVTYSHRVWTPPVTEERCTGTGTSRRCTTVVVQAGYYTYYYDHSYRRSTTNYSPSNRISPSTGGLHAMRPCFDRGYRSVTATGLNASFDNDEDPSSATFGSRMSVEFYLPNPPTGAGVKGLREPLRVKLDINGDFYVKHVNGSITRPWPQPKISGQLSGSNIMHDSGSRSPTTYQQLYTDIFQASFPTMRVGDKACFTIRGLQRQGTMNTAGDRTSASGFSQSAEVCSSPLVNKPYAKIFGQDVITGGAFSGGNCFATSRIGGYYNAAKSGTAAQLALLAMDQIDGFASAAVRSSTPVPLMGLTFANSGSVGTYGGHFGGSRCTTNYWAQKPGILPANSINSHDPAVTSGPVYITPPSGTLTITATAPIVDRKTLYVDGNVVINSDLNYYTGGSGWANAGNIPSLYVIARGSIYINSNVRNIDGIFIAQSADPNNRSSGGRIYTCTSGTSQFGINNLFANCNTPLVINGGFVAQEVKLQRTANSLRYSTRSEDPLDGPRACAPEVAGAYAICAAEVFNFTPEVYLVEPALPQSAKRLNLYDAITSLPPIF